MWIRNVNSNVRSNYLTSEELAVLMEQSVKRYRYNCERLKTRNRQLRHEATRMQKQAIEAFNRLIHN